MEKYESKQQCIQRSAEQIYEWISDFDRFTPVLRDRVQEWRVEGDTCSFTVQGMRVTLSMVEKEPGRHVKIVSGEGSPLSFTFWIQLKEAAPYDTRLRLVLHVELNLFMRMMIGGKIQKAIDQMAEQMATAFNTMPA